MRIADWTIMRTAALDVERRKAALAETELRIVKAHLEGAERRVRELEHFIASRPLETQREWRP
jgi:hypothetical protein